MAIKLVKQLKKTPTGKAVKKSGAEVAQQVLSKLAKSSVLKKPVVATKPAATTETKAAATPSPTLTVSATGAKAEVTFTLPLLSQSNAYLEVEIQGAKQWLAKESLVRYSVNDAAKTVRVTMTRQQASRRKLLTTLVAEAA
jgi:hypothetical protein